MKTYLALLRGINVGGKNIVRMAELRELLINHGFEGVQTYIQSGNIVLRYGDGDVEKVKSKLEAVFDNHLIPGLKVLVYDIQMFERILQQVPPGFGTSPEKYKYDVCFCFDGDFDVDALRAGIVRDGVDEMHVADGAIFFRRDAAQLTKSRLSKITAFKEYQLMTIRNWNTTTKLRKMMEEAGVG